MKDFRKKMLYDNEMGLFKAVVEEKIQTASEYNEVGKFMVGNEEEDEEVSYLSGMSDMDGFDINEGFGDFGGFDSLGTDFSGESDKEKSMPRDEWEQLTPSYNKFLHSLYWTSVYTYRGMLFDNPFSEESENTADELKALTIAGLVSFGLGMVGITGIFNTLVHPIAGVLGLGIGVLADIKNIKDNGQGYFKDVLKDVLELETEENEEDSESSELEGSEFNEEESFDTEDIFGGFGGFGESSGGGGDSLANYFEGEDGIDDDEEDYEDDDEMDEEIKRIVPESTIPTDNEVDFNEGLLEVFRRGNRHKGKMLRSREEILRSFSGYLPSNDSSFANWRDVRENSVEYKNIAFTLYKALVQLEKKFSIETKSNDVLTILTMEKTPIIYKMEVKLPTYFREKLVLGMANILNNHLKASDNDTEVGSIISTYSGNYIFKFLRLDYRGLISFGDIIRYRDENTGEAPVEYMTEDKGIPILVGMKDNEYPYVFDLEDNTSAAIVGGSGSGKSWLTFQLVMSMLVTNSPEELNFLILDAKNANFWKQIAKAPHVLGYHSDIDSFLGILNEVNKEHLRRMDKLSASGYEDLKGYRRAKKKEGDWEAVREMPFLVVVIDEITYTMSQLNETDKETHDALKALIVSLSAVVRASGIRLMAIGQRAIDSSIPKTYMFNASMKFGMKMENKSEYEHMFSKGYQKGISRLPNVAGEGLIKVNGDTEIGYIKSLVPGGFNDDTLTSIMRAVSLDWTRRTIGTGVDYDKPFGGMSTTLDTAFNRPDLRSEALNDLRQGMILRIGVISEGYQVNVEPGERGDTSNFQGVNENTEVFSHKKEREIVEEPIKKEEPKEVEFDFEDIEIDLDDDFLEAPLDSVLEDIDIDIDDDVFGDDWGDIAQETEEIDVQFADELGEEKETEEIKESNDNFRLEIDEEDVGVDRYQEEGIGEEEIKGFEEIDGKEEVGKESILGEGILKEDELVSFNEEEETTLTEEPKTEEVGKTVIDEGLQSTKVEEQEDNRTEELGVIDYEDDVMELDLDALAEMGAKETKRKEREQAEKKQEEQIKEREETLRRREEELKQQEKETQQRMKELAKRQEEARKEQEVEEKRREDLRLARELEDKKEDKPTPTSVKKRKVRRDTNVVSTRVQPKKSGVSDPVTKGRKVDKGTQGLSVKQYILENGMRINTFERSIDDTIIKDKYTKREIDIALSTMQIYMMDGKYVASFS